MLCLKIILGVDYSSYDEVLITAGLNKLSTKRESRCLKFGLKSVLHPVHSQLFPVNPQVYADIPTKELKAFWYSECIKRITSFTNSTTQAYMPKCIWYWGWGCGWWEVLKKSWNYYKYYFFQKYIIKQNDLNYLHVRGLH